MSPVHGEPVQGNGLPSVHRTPMSLAHGIPVRGNGLPAMHWTPLFPCRETRHRVTASRQCTGRPYPWCTGTRCTGTASSPPLTSPPVPRCRPCRVRRSGEAGTPRAAAGPFYGPPPPRPGGEGRSGPGNCPANADWPSPRSPGRPLAAPGGRGPAPARASREAKFQETWLRARSPAGAGRECRGAGAGARVWGSRGSRDQGFREQGVTGIWGS